MRYNRKACQRAIKLAVARNDMRVIPFGLVFRLVQAAWRNSAGYARKQYFKGAAQCSLDDEDSVRMRCVDTGDTFYIVVDELIGAVKPRSLKKHELRKQARDLRRMRQYD